MSTQYPSRVPVVTDWLLANLPAATGLDALQICDGPPTEADMRSTCIILGDTDMDQDWAALGARNRDENSVIHCTIYLVGPGQSQTDVNKAAFALLALIESYLRTNLTLGSNVNWAGVVPTTLLKQLGDNARIAVLDFNLKFFARI